jgi:hypothetical protein
MIYKGKGKKVEMKQKVANISWNAGAVPPAGYKACGKVIAMMEKEPKGEILEMPTDAGVFGRLAKGDRV